MEDLTRIIDLQINELTTRLSDQSLHVTLTIPAKEFLVSEGYNPIYGARPLRRTVQRLIETPLSRMLLKGEFRPGDQIEIDAVEGQLVFNRGGVLKIASTRPTEPLGA